MLEEKIALDLNLFQPWKFHSSLPKDALATTKSHPTPVWVPALVRLCQVLFSRVSEPPSSCEFFRCWLKPPLLELARVNPWSYGCAILSSLLSSCGYCRSDLEL
ncbi:uncharacterized protein DS421_9g257560 [Arachis hypogaea]|nr:uncharacterized protein DS421_9g257560 [Arachis hypogaea]